MNAILRQSLLLLTLGVCAPLQSVRSDEQANAVGIAYFEQHIRPLVAMHCYACHSEQKTKREGGLLLDSRQGWATGGDHGPAIVPSDPDASLLIQAVRYADPDRQMPPDKALSNDEIAHLEQWVQMGAPDPRDIEIPVRTETHRPSDPVVGRQHWAFQPLTDPEPPATTNSDWTRSPIDRFMLAVLEANKLQPAPDAEKTALLRRLSFQLVGLPPTPAQVDSFSNNQSPDAYECLVDQLLNSPQFGQRWGRHWLDLARYADSNGLDENFLFREAWRYRNWVIDAVNADMPLDRFLLEQIAGDLLPFDSIEQRDRQRIAAGFLVVGPKVLLGNDAHERIMDVADEQLNTIGRAVLGQTMGCARCHDHKFDPIPTADYYAMAGILTSTKVLEQRYMLGEQRVMEQLTGLGAEGDQIDSAYEAYWRDLAALKETQKHAKAAVDLLKGTDATAFSDFAAAHPDAIGEGVADQARTMPERVDTQAAFLADIDKSIANPPPIPPRAMIPSDVESPADEFIRLSGRFDQKGEQVRRGFLQVIGSPATGIPPTHSGRQELALWLTDVDNGAGHLAARVLANRVWQHLIGRGIVRTVDNFGRTGETPSHPELLDLLATELIQSGWSVKSLIRQIVLSRTFTMSSRHDAAAHDVDPDNRLLWRAHRQRLDPESLRDALLAAAGTLDLKPMESTVSYLGDQATAVGPNTNRRRTDFPCRSVYLPVIRNDLPEVFDVFNFTDPQDSIGMRPNTIKATQGLFLLNDKSVMDAAEATARRVLAESPTDDLNAVAAAMHQLLFADRGSDDERETIMRYVTETQRQLTASGDAEAGVHAWAMACHALFATSRFQMLE